MPVGSAPYPFPLDGDLSPAATALLVIDMQGDFLLPGGFMDALGLPLEAMRAVVPQVQALLDGFRAQGYTILHTREGFAADLSDAQPNRLWRGPNADAPLVGDRGPMGRYLVRGEANWDIVSEVAPRPGEIVLDKPSYGAFGTTDLEAILKGRGLRNLVVCGVTSDCCVHSTVQEALDRGFDCLTVSDASAAAFRSIHDDLMARIRAKGGVFGAVADTAGVLGALPPSA